MASVSGRIASAQLLRNNRRAQASRAQSRISLRELQEPNNNVESNVEENVNNKQADEEQQEKEIYKILTPEKIDQIKQEIEKRKKKIQEKKEKISKSRIPAEGKLVDGEIIYNEETEKDEDIEDEILEKDISLTDGNQLPTRLGTLPKELAQRPLEELDSYIMKREETFVVIAKRFNKYFIYRFSAAKSFFIFSPFNRIRRALIFMCTWQFFDIFMILTILANCVLMAIQLPQSQSNIAEDVFTAIYSIEFIIKVVARGFFMNPYTYLRDPWNWLDFLLLILSYVTIIVSQLQLTGVNLSSLRALRVFRAFKTINIITGLKTIVNAILKAFIMFMEVLFLMVFVLIIFSLFALQAFSGSFSQKCVLVYNSSATNVNYSAWIRNESNWYFDSNMGEYALCANGTTTNEGRTCPDGYVCLGGIGTNPDNGLTHFDNFGFCMKENFQVISLDNWEAIYNRVTDSMGPWNIIYFLPIVFIGSFYLVNLMLAVVSLAYKIESENEKKKYDFVPPKKNNAVYDIEMLKAKIAQKAKELEEKKKKKEVNNSDTHARSAVKSANEKPMILKVHDSGLKRGVGDVVERDDNEIATLSSIKLSDNMGKYNNMIQEGKASCHFHGKDLVSDDRNCYCCLKFGKYYIKLVLIQNLFLKIASSAYFELFITFLIILNTLIMAIQYDGQPSQIDDLQTYFNYIAFSIFVVEAIFKIIAYWKLYFLDLSNWFDLFIICIGIVDFSVPQVQGLSVIRSFRLLRIFKLAKTWKTMRRILVIIMRSMSGLGYLSLVVFIVIYIFAIIGMDLFQDSYNQYYSTDEMPRSNFLGILNSLLMILRILCGECQQPLHECWTAAGPSCIILFYPTVLFGNFLILNLFLAMLLDAFDASAVHDNADEEEDAITKEFKRLKEKFKEKKQLFKQWFNRKRSEWNKNATYNENNLQDNNYNVLNEEQGEKKKNNEINDEEALVNCLPDSFYKKLCRFSTKDTKLNKYWFKFRRFFLKFIEHKVFEGFIIVCIFGSSLLLAFEDVYLKTVSTPETVLKVFDYIFQAIFFTEMILKWIGFGFKKYFTDWWCILDSIIVLISIINLGFVLSQSTTDIAFLKVLRTLRAFRPLRAISKLEGMRIVVNALGRSIPAIFDVLVVCMVFWLIFAIMGVTLFKGKFYSCVDSLTGSAITNVSNKTDCLNVNGAMWYNAKINFDNVGISYLALLQLATFEGWQDIMNNGVDAVDVNIQPKRESNQVAYLYFVFFIILGSFFTLNLFVGVIIDNFNELKKKYESGVADMFLTSSQKNYLKTIKNMGKKKPKKSITRPQNKIQGLIYDIVASTRFQVSISIIIVINVISMAFEYYHQPDYYDNIFTIINTVFVTIYGLEIIFKMIGMRQHFFRNPWNVLEFLITILCTIALPFELYVEQIMIKPTMFYVIRLFQLFRALRFVNAAKGIRKLLFALLISLPALFNVALLLFLIIFIYAIIGMNFFMNVQLQNSLTPNSNFQTFGKTFMLLFRVGTISGWNDVLQALMLTSSDPGTKCEDHFDIQSMPLSVDPQNVNGCGNPGVAIPYMVSYVIIVRMVLINMYIAVILENYEQAHEQEEIGITEDDFEHFYQVWEKYDPYATQFVRLDQLTDLLAELDPPLGQAKPNDMAITSFNLPIIKGELVHCLDVLHALTTYALGGIEDTHEFKEVQKQIDEKFWEHFPVRVRHAPVTTTIQRKKLEIAARTLQRAWRKFKLQKTIREAANTVRNSNNMK